jgi:hypothetical protein
VSTPTRFEEFERDFAHAFPGAKCFKFVVVLETSDGNLARVSVLRHGYVDPDDDDPADVE